MTLDEDGFETLDLFTEADTTLELPVDIPVREEQRSLNVGQDAPPQWPDFSLFGYDLFGEEIKPKPGGPLAERFYFPPFTVLNAREGAWQERKRAWIALGIQSELGRGGNLIDYSENAASHYRNGDYQKVSPGGSPRPACDYSNRERGAGNGKPLETASLQGGLTHNTTIHPYDDYGKQANAKAFGTEGNIAGTQTGTSIFDPVLAELMYRWFCPEGGTILDPFAGGSVRGIVAAKLGFQYHGIDLSGPQIAANEQQWREMEPPVPVKVSAAMARLRFHGCEPGYIRDVCHARCCESSTRDIGTLITIHPSEEAAIRARGGEVDGGLLVTSGKCTFKTAEDLCSLHATADKPFGCIASPFTLNEHDTLIVRNRYKLLKCYDDGPRLPAYHAFRASLVRLFGEATADRIVAHFDVGGEDLTVGMPAANYRKLKDNDAIKHGAAPTQNGVPRWYCGDSLDLVDTMPEADFIFSCPPYGDLERYSNDPLDLSTMEYHTFLAVYKRIILRCALKLKDNRLACFVVGDFRDKRTGMYRGFPVDTVQAFREVGLDLYNEAVLVTQVGSLPIRVSGQFDAGRKLGKTHQNVLVFAKGNPRLAFSERQASDEQETERRVP